MRNRPTTARRSARLNRAASALVILALFLAAACYLAGSPLFLLTCPLFCCLLVLRIGGVLSFLLS